MIALPAVLGFAYLGALVIGLVLSFTTRRQPLRRNIRIATTVLTVPILLLVTLWVFIMFYILKEPPTLADLQRDFPPKRTDLEMILRMSDEDLTFFRIAPTFLDRTTGNPNEFGRYMENDPRAGLPRSRWDAYRRIYNRNGIKLGVQRDASHNVFIMVDSVGLLNRGHTSGYVHCAPTVSPGAGRYHPCMMHQERGGRRYDPKTRNEGYSFQKLDDGWYAYDEGPG